MPNLANVTVKKYDGTTDTIYYGIQPGNQNEFSVHKALALGATDNTKPEFRVQVRRNAKEWIVTYWFMYPYHVVSTDTNVTTVRRMLLGKTVQTIPLDVPTTVIYEYAAQFANLQASNVVRSCVIDGANFV